MGNVKVKEVKDVDALRVSQLTGVEALRLAQFTGVEPLRIGQIAPAAVHIKELNHIDPISVESLRVDEVQNVEPLRIESLNVTGVPPLDLSVRQIPSVDLNVKRVPPVSIGLHQDFVMPSDYTVHARVLGVELMRFQIHGTTRLAPKDRVRRERSQTHERSFPDVASVGNPAIPVKTEEVRAHSVAVPKQGPHRRPAAPSKPPARKLKPRPKSPCSPHFQFSIPDPKGSSNVGGGDL